MIHTTFWQVWTYQPLKTLMNKIHYLVITTTWICLKEWDLEIKVNLVHSLASQTWVDHSNKRLHKACQSFKRNSSNLSFKSTDTKASIHYTTSSPNHNSSTSSISKNNVLSKKKLNRKHCYQVALRQFSVILERFIMSVV